MVGAFDAKTHFSRLLERVTAGEEFTITKHGHPVARLIPVTSGPSNQSRKEAIQKMRELASRQHLNGVHVRDLISEGRK